MAGLALPGSATSSNFVKAWIVDAHPLSKIPGYATDEEIYILKRKAQARVAWKIIV